jgi:hypothetical protein
MVDNSLSFAWTRTGGHSGAVIIVVFQPDGIAEASAITANDTEDVRLKAAIALLTMAELPLGTTLCVVRV